MSSLTQQYLFADNDDDRELLETVMRYKQSHDCWDEEVDELIWT